ncbi:MAG: glucose-inhibited division protein A [Rhizonema sp. PD37]|nr:glucose-inhibited division protein A [Rhizonema sp. PD37]
MNRSKIVAIFTGAISIMLAIAYLILVQLLDFRGEMKPAPVSQLQRSVIVAQFPGVEQLLIPHFTSNHVPR